MVGLDYPYSRNMRLHGTRKDAYRVAACLRRQGFHVTTMVGGIASRVTRDVLAGALRRHEDLQGVDHFFFYFSGHGVGVPSSDGHEVDGWDEALVCDRPLRSNAPTLLLDNDLNRMLRRFPRDTRVSVLVDACHSGSICDLPVTRVASGIVHRSRATYRPTITSIGSARDDEVALEYRSAGVLTDNFLRLVADGHRQALDLTRRMNDDMRRCGKTSQQCILSTSMEGGFQEPFI